MKKVLISATALTMALCLAGCASTKKGRKSPLDKIPVVIEPEGVERPQWVMSGKGRR